MKFFILFFVSLNLCALNLEIIGRQILETKVFDGTKVGGLSGIRYNFNNNKLFAISDDRAIKSPVRIYQFDLDIINFEAKLEKIILLKNENKQAYSPKSIDFEDIEILSNGDFLLSSEAQTLGLEIISPELIIFNNEGAFKTKLKVSKHFIPIRENGYFISGQKNNRGFEALCKLNSFDSFFVTSETSLIQDQQDNLRIVLYSNLESVKEYSYQISKVENEYNPILNLGAMNGLSAMLCLDDLSLITVERSFHPLLNRFSTTLYEVNLTANQSPNSVLKRKIMTIKDSDNIEGITWGPTLSNGNKSIILITDDNFSKFQKTILTYIEIKQ